MYIYIYILLNILNGLLHYPLSPVKKMDRSIGICWDCKVSLNKVAKCY